MMIFPKITYDQYLTGYNEKLTCQPLCRILAQWFSGQVKCKVGRNSLIKSVGRHSDFTTAARLIS